MGNMSEMVVYHGTDYDAAESIVAGDFTYESSDEHWLGNGVYFYYDLSLANWWTTKPSKKFGTKIKKPAVIECVLSLKKKNVLDLRDLKQYLWFSEVYKNEFISELYKGYIKVNIDEKTGKFQMKKLRCAFCDFIKRQYAIEAIVGTFDLPQQKYLPDVYGEGFLEFSLNYIEVQICLFQPSAIKSKKILN